MEKTIGESIDDKIDEWHEGDSELSLHEYLGMTWEVYQKFVTENNYGTCYQCEAVIKEGQKALPFTVLDTKWFCCDACLDNYIHSK